MAKFVQEKGVNLLEGINEGLPEEKNYPMKRASLLTMNLLNENCLFFKYAFIIFLRRIYFNADELGLFWRTSPGDSITKRHLEEKLKYGNSLPYPLCVNVDGIEKSDLMITGKAECLRSR